MAKFSRIFWLSYVPRKSGTISPHSSGLSADGLQEALPFGEHLAEAKTFSHSPTGKARGLLRRRIKISGGSKISRPRPASGTFPCLNSCRAKQDHQNISGYSRWPQNLQ